MKWVMGIISDKDINNADIEIARTTLEREKQLSFIKGFKRGRKRAKDSHDYMKNGHEKRENFLGFISTELRSRLPKYLNYEPEKIPEMGNLLNIYMGILLVGLQVL